MLSRRPVISQRASCMTGGVSSCCIFLVATSSTLQRARPSPLGGLPLVLQFDRIEKSPAEATTGLLPYAGHHGSKGRPRQAFRLLRRSQAARLVVCRHFLVHVGQKLAFANLPRAKGPGVRAQKAGRRA